LRRQDINYCGRDWQPYMLKYGDRATFPLTIEIIHYKIDM
jgi:hypothetical protein